MKSSYELRVAELWIDEEYFYGFDLFDFEEVRVAKGFHTTSSPPDLRQ